jgi:hypothetical protein
MGQRIQFTFVGQANRPPNVWAEMDVVPRVGETVAVPGQSQGDTIVRTVVWYPFGDDESDDTEPFVYVVLGQSRQDAPFGIPKRDR